MMEGKLVKPIKFLCRHDAESYKIINPKTENRYRFWRGQPYLVKIKEDIEFLDSHDLFIRVFDEVNEKEIKKQVKRDLKEEKEAARTEQPQEDVKGAKANVDGKDMVYNGKKWVEVKPEKVDKYSKAQLRKMKKSEVRTILKLLSDKDCPVRKNNIINLILEVQ